MTATVIARTITIVREDDGSIRNVQGDMWKITDDAGTAITPKHVGTKNGITAEEIGTWFPNADLTAQIGQLQTDKAALTTERDALQTQLTESTAERDNARAALETMTATRDAVQTDLATCTTERDALQTQLTERTTERDAIRVERDAIRVELETVTARRDAVQADLAACTTERVALICERDAITSQRNALTAQALMVEPLKEQIRILKGTPRFSPLALLQKITPDDLQKITTAAASAPETLQYYFQLQNRAATTNASIPIDSETFQGALGKLVEAVGVPRVAEIFAELNIDLGNGRYIDPSVS